MGQCPLARRKAGDTLRLMRERGELADRGRQEQMSQRGTFTLSDLGITRNQSSRWQAEAAVPEDVYQVWVNEILDAGGELTASGLRKLCKKSPSLHRTSTLRTNGARFRRTGPFSCFTVAPG